MISTILVTISFLFLMYASYCIFIFIRRKKFTRERYAFIYLQFLFSIFTFFTSSIIGNNPFLTILFNFLGIPEYTPGLSDKVLVGAALMFITSKGYKVYENWDHKKSKNQAEEEKNGQRPNIIRDIKLVINKDPLLDEKEKENYNEDNYTSSKIDKISWPNRAKKILVLKDKHFKIKEEDWYSKDNFYYSNYGHNNECVAIWCVKKMVTDLEINYFLKRLSQYKLKKVSKVIVMIKNLNEEKIEKIIKEIRIEIYTEENLLKNLIDFTDYYDDIANKYEKEEIMKGYDLTISDTFVEPILSCTDEKDEVKGTVEINNFKQYVEEWCENSKGRKQLAILGEYGQGKSVLVQWLTYSIIKKNIQTKRIPILIELRGQFPKQFSNVKRLLLEWSDLYDINTEALYQLYLADKLLIIFDGFDEMELVGDETVRQEHFQSLWQVASGSLGSKMIITGRPNLFVDNNELEGMLRLNNKIPSIPYCEALYIKKFNLEQIRNSLRSIDSEVRNEIMNLLKNDSNKSFKDLVSRPAMLFLSSIVWKEGFFSKYKQKMSSVMIIKEFILNTYSRQKSKEIKTPPLGIFERDYFMQGIAIGVLLKNGYTNQIKLSDLKSIFTKLYREFPEELTNEEQKYSTKQIKPLKKRYSEANNEKTIFRDVISSGVLVRDLSNHDSFKFAHKSFLEYFISANNIYSTLKNSNENNRLEKIKSIHIEKALKVKSMKLLKNNEVIDFCPEILAFELQNLKGNKNIEKKVFLEILSHSIFRIFGIKTYFTLQYILKIYFGNSGISRNKYFRMITFSLLVGYSIGVWSILKSVENNTSLRNNSELIITSLAILISILSLLIAIKTFKFKVFLDEIRNVLKRKFKESEMFLWFSTCLELGVDKNFLYKKTPRMLKGVTTKTFENK